MNYIAFLFIAASITGTLANSFQKKWCFWVWVCTNSFWCIYNTLNKQYAQALLYAFNFATCIIGLCKWKEKIISVDVSNGIDKTCTVKGIRKKDELQITSVIYDEPQAERQETGKASFDLSEEPLKEAEDQLIKAAKAVTDFTSALIDIVQPTIKAFADTINNFAKLYCNGDYNFLKWQTEHANKHILHMAYNAKRHRTRKKNIARLQHEYRKFVKKGGGGV